MNGLQRIKTILEGNEPDRAAVSGWIHTPLLDRDTEKFVAFTIDFAEKNGWDVIKVMPNGYYFSEAYGADITFSNDATQWAGVIHKYPLEKPADVSNIPVLGADNDVFAREVAAVKAVKRHFGDTRVVLPTMFTPLTWIQEMSSSTKPAFTQDLTRNHKDELHKGLRALVETCKKVIDAYIDAGADGIFYATQFAQDGLLTDESFAEFAEPYDIEVLDHIQGRTWFNMLHIHGTGNLLLDKFKSYPVQAWNWENVPEGFSGESLPSVTKTRSLTNAVLVAGIDQHHDFNAANRNIVHERLTRRFEAIKHENGGNNRFVFAPGCALPMNVGLEIFSLLVEIAEENTTKA
jgi:uroporphyrinogen decarboxylase